MRKMGFEPGTKKKKRGGFSDDNFGVWESEGFNIDIRHKDAFSPSKLKLKDFTHKPKWWEETPIESIEDWDLKGLS